MNTAQIWSIVAIMAAGLATMITLTFGYVGAKFDTLNQRFIRIDERFERIDERFERLEAKFDHRFDHLDRDMQRVIERIFP